MFKKRSRTNFAEKISRTAVNVIVLFVLEANKKTGPRPGRKKLFLAYQTRISKVFGRDRNPYLTLLI